ncbi:hypothetical protein M3Y98_00582200 [Aphelenchoides besseyi]|nr:hypothetical protein M3Y98_00582200 [Aphelenchoides besseyi]KAI6193894.1 hypothetical protein M3Y96_01067200 [Aphelenchoides besseyi]KAI6193938.1 hypothetical protein M3Y96_01071700 [Aphelenchoides besseyi]
MERANLYKQIVDKISDSVESTSIKVAFERRDTRLLVVAVQLLLVSQLCSSLKFDMNKQLFFIVAVAFVLVALMQVQVIEAGKKTAAKEAAATVAPNSTASSMFSSIGLVVVPMVQLALGGANF